MSLIAVLYLLGAVQGGFLALLLFTHKEGNWQANRYLGLLTLVMTLDLADYTLDESGLITLETLWLSILLWPKELFYGPLLFLYTRELIKTAPEQKNKRKWLHFLPALVHIIVSWSLLFLPVSEQINILQGNATGGWKALVAFLLGDFELYVCLLHAGIYLSACLYILYLHKQRINKSYYQIEKINITWLFRLSVGLMGLYLFWVAAVIFSSESSEATWYRLLGAAMVMVVYMMGFLGLRQPRVFTIPDMVSLEKSSSSDHLLDSFDVEKYKNSPLSEGVREELFNTLKKYMESEQPYLKSTLTLPDLAQGINISVHYLSQIINQESGKNFFDFVNEYRVMEAQKILKKDKYKKENIAGLSTLVGFNSKSAFYAAFKKYTGVSPGQYRNGFVNKE